MTLANAPAYLYLVVLPAAAMLSGIAFLVYLVRSEMQYKRNRPKRARLGERPA